MENYQGLLKDILDRGFEKEDRTGTGTLSLHGGQLRFDLKQGFPLVTTKFVPLRLILGELLWFLSGSTNNKDLTDQDIYIWREDNYNYYKQMGGELSYEAFCVMLSKNAEYGDLGKQYGWLWRSLGHYNKDGEYLVVDQIESALTLLRDDKASRRNIVSSWNVSTLDEMALNACHTMFQLLVRDDTVDIVLYMRSADTFLGLPFNIASYAVLLLGMVEYLGMQPGELIVNIGDSHIYKNHIEQVEEQITRQPFKKPKLRFSGGDRSGDFYRFMVTSEILLLDYEHHPAIKGKLSTGLK